ncbi:RNA methyltransferase [Actinomyces sp. 2119]|uniref:RNA methyltransferase n=2 Tax=Actinomycetaceae TaxID=2049 RepID=A0ABN5PRE0_9ACTO|nr:MULTISPECIES: RNA methyltransferase [Actinomyces]AYD89614.1 RNA methyltransferase [Actinomyces lilanjuaniae]RJF40232.1 RNA methyltransferase [Actinomyces sp. 2119]
MSPRSTSADLDDLLLGDDDAPGGAGGPQDLPVRGPRRRTMTEGVAAGHEVLVNPGSTRVARVAGLVRRTARARHHRFLVEGPQGVREAVAYAPDRVLDLYMTERALERHPEIWVAAEEAGLYRHLTSERVMEAMSPDAQGVLAVAAMEEATGSEALASAVKDARLVAVLVEIQDPGNAGTMIRVADAAGADAVVLVRGCVEATSPKVVRSTAGSLFHLPVVTGVALDDTVSALRGAGLAVLAADRGGELDLFDATDLLSAPAAWVLGNEAQGLGPQVLEQADASVSVPVYGRAESLNVAAAAAVCLYASAQALRS